MRPNPAFYILVAAAGAVGLALVILAAEAHGKRRQQKQAWRYDPCGSPAVRRAT